MIARRGGLGPPEEEISGVTFHRVYRGIVGQVRRRGDGSGGTASEGGRGFQGRAYRIYLETCFAFYVACIAAQLIESQRLDVILERETAFGAGAMASAISGRPMVLEMIGPQYSPLSIRRCSKVLAYNDLMVPREAKAKAIFIKAAVNLNLFKPDRELARRRRRALGLNGAVTVGYVGSFLDWHGVDVLLDAAEIIKRQFVRVEFIMVGPHTAAIAESVTRRGLNDIVHLIGPVEYDCVPSYVNACDILVAPYNVRGTSRSKKGIGSPLKVLEYMACGKPAIGSDLAQVADLIDDGKNGLLFPQGDAASLASAIVTLAQNRELREEMGARATESVSERYSWLSLSKQLTTILNDVCVRPVR